MSKSLIVGRKAELKILNQVYESPEAEFVAIYGRRRIGKTFLVSEFFKDKDVYFEVTGIKNGRLSKQLFQFAYEFGRCFGSSIEEIPTLKSWAQAFQLLNEAIEKTAAENGKIVLFFDELPWFAGRKSGFLSALEHFWNRYASRHPRVILIVCGSVASWIIRRIIYNKGGLHGRLTRTLQLLPFSLAETEAYLSSRQISLNRKQIAEIYMAIGGIPKYLSHIKRGESAAQNISALFIPKTGPLYDEFTKLYQSLFEHYEHHIALVKTLARHSFGLTQTELLKQAGLPSGGTSTKIIEELEDTGFISYMAPFNHKKTGGKYRLTDEYSLFYLNKSSKNIWAGQAFELLCLKHQAQIKKALGISGIKTQESNWWYLPAKGSDDTGAQIDLVIDRSDHCINLCEMKFYDAPWSMGKEDAAKLRSQKEVFRQHSQTNKALLTTVISVYGLKKNMHSLGVVDSEVTLDDLFSS